LIQNSDATILKSKQKTTNNTQDIGMEFDNFFSFVQTRRYKLAGSQYLMTILDELFMLCYARE